MLMLMYTYIQQDEVLAELCEYARSQPPPADASSIELTIDYLSALNKLFERSLLGNKVRVFDPWECYAENGMWVSILCAVGM